MTKLQKIILGVVAVLALIGGGSVLLHKGGTLGDATVSNYPTWYYNGIVIGPANKIIQNAIVGSCNASTATTVPADTSETLSCSVPGAKVGDKAFVSSSTGSITSHDNGFVVLAARVASNNVLTVDLGNLTATTALPDSVINFANFR